MQRKNKLCFHHNIVSFCLECCIRKKMTKLEIYLCHKSMILWWKCDKHVFVKRKWLCLSNTKSWFCDDFVMANFKMSDVECGNFVIEMWSKCNFFLAKNLNLEPFFCYSLIGPKFDGKQQCCILMATWWWCIWP